MKKNIKFQTDLMKLYEKNKLIRYWWGKNNDTYFITIDGNYAVFIPEYEFYLSRKLFFAERTFWKDACKLMDCDESYLPAKITEMGVDEFGTLYKLATTNSITCWVTEKNLKYFDFKTLTFKIKNSTSPVMVYEDNKLVGLVMPVRRND